MRKEIRRSWSQLELIKREYPRRPDSEVWHVVCYSGGHSSFLTAVEVSRKYGTDRLVLLNHDIRADREMPDVKRFKREGADYLQVPVVYANYGQSVFAPDGGFCTDESPPLLDQFEVCEKHSAFKPPVGTEICTSRLKTEPFSKWVDHFFPNRNCVIYYGFDMNERARIQRRSSALASMGLRGDFPLALWQRTIVSSEEVGIDPPNTYSCFKHANCVGCLKAGRQHWYVVFCRYPDVFERAKRAEDEIGFSIMRGEFLEECEHLFIRMREREVPATEHIVPQKFWADVRRLGLMTEKDSEVTQDQKPCECVF